MRVGGTLLLLVSLPACHRPAVERAQPAPAAPSGEPAASATAGTSLGTPCGELGCMQYASVEDAFREAIAGDPRVVAIGEAHAQRGSSVPSSARRFTDTLLPLLAGRASDLLVELMNPPSGCAAKAQAVKKQQEVVTSHQAEGDQSEYVAMGERANKIGIVPDLLRPTCADLDAIHDAGDDAIVVSLATIARLTRVKVEQLVDRDARTPADAGKMVVTYGGAIHHDRNPPPERADFCFGHDIDAYVKGRYVEIDLYVPEFIEDTEVWKKLEWYPHYDRAKLGAKTTMFRGERKFVIVFPVTRP